MIIFIICIKSLAVDCIDSTDEIFSFSKEEQLSNEFGWILVLYGSIVTSIKLTHPLKQFSPIDSTDDGITICVSDVHSSNNEFSIDFNDEGC